MKHFKLVIIFFSLVKLVSGQGHDYDSLLTLLGR